MPSPNGCRPFSPVHAEATPPSKVAAFELSIAVSFEGGTHGLSRNVVPRFSAFGKEKRRGMRDGRRKGEVISATCVF